MAAGPAGRPPSNREGVDRLRKGKNTWIDVHTHLDRYSGRDFLKEIKIERILSISNSMDPESYRANKELAAGCPLIIPAFGVHPWNASPFARSMDSIDKCLR